VPAGISSHSRAPGATLGTCKLAAAAVTNVIALTDTSRHRASPRNRAPLWRAPIWRYFTRRLSAASVKGGRISDRSLIFNAKGTQIGYIEGDRAFDLTGNYARETGNLSELDGKKIVGYISLDGTFVGLS
jgi:hypothetical protein